MAAFTVIDHTELGAAAASWGVTSIPSSYDHLLIKASTRVDSAGYTVYNKLNFNADTGSNYSMTFLYALSATPTSGRAATGAEDYIGYIYSPRNDALADTYGCINIWIPNYANTTNFKQVLASSTGPNASTTDSQWIVAQCAGLWSSTAAIDQVTLAGFANFHQYSTFTLYGVTGA